MKSFLAKPFKIIVSLLLIITIIFASVFILKIIFPDEYGTLIKKHSKEYGIDVYTAFALIKAESNFNPDVVSHANAKGLMQLTNETFLFCKSNTSLGNDIFNPENNIKAGMWYLSFLNNKFNHNTENVLAAYNAGASNVIKWLKNENYSADGISLETVPYEETRNYIKRVRSYRKIYYLLYPQYR
ncbi:MAG: lytic transglycosylase domain-containing protein [Clostridia bacterium]|nr:lytic transglycosylase domain-containing protein [Clostridia bacterium]